MAKTYRKRVKNPDQYEALRDEGMSKENAAREDAFYITGEVTHPNGGDTME